MNTISTVIYNLIMILLQNNKQETPKKIKKKYNVIKFNQ